MSCEPLLPDRKVSSKPREPTLRGLCDGLYWTMISFIKWKLPDPAIMRAWVGSRGTRHLSANPTPGDTVSVQTIRPFNQLNHNRLVCMAFEFIF